MSNTTRWSNPANSQTGAAALILTGVALEISAGATSAQRRAFFRAVGGRIATIHPLDQVTDIAGLTNSTNALWHDYGCGEVRFEMAEDGILITHSGLAQNFFPVLGEATEQVLSPFLEGAYDGWLRTMGSGPRLTTRTLWWSNLEARLKHGL